MLLPIDNNQRKREEKENDEIENIEKKRKGSMSDEKRGTFMKEKEKEEEKNTYQNRYEERQGNDSDRWKETLLIVYQVILP